MFNVVGCPARMPADIRNAMKAADRAKTGSWPIAGGWLDQTQKCLDAIDFIERDQADWERRHKEGS